MKTTACGFINGLKTLPGSSTQVLTLTLLCGTDKKGDARKLYGNFFLSANASGWDEVSKKLKDGKSEEVFEVVIKDLHANPALGRGDVIFENYQGLVTSVKLKEPRG